MVIYALHPKAKSLVIQAAHGLPEDVLTSDQMLSGLRGGQRCHPQRATGGRRKRLRLLPDESDLTATATEWCLVNQMTALYQAWLAVPLVIKGDTYGAILVYYQQPRNFSAEEITLAMAFSDQVALAIENARLRMQAEQAAVMAERNRLARELHDAVSQTLFSTSMIAEVLPRLWYKDRAEGMSAPGRAAFAHPRRVSRDANVAV